MVASEGLTEDCDFVCTLQLKDFVWSTENRLLLFLVQDNRVTDHRLKMNFELMSFLGGNIESAVQVKLYLQPYLSDKISLFSIFPNVFFLFSTKNLTKSYELLFGFIFFTVLHCYGAEGITRRISRVGWCT